MNASHQQGQPRLRAALILACTANFMGILDIAIVNVALPPIRQALGFSEVGLQWVLNGYTITSAGFLLLGGRAADLLGHRSVFVWGMRLFAVASLTGGLADSRTVMLSARLAQGLGAAVIAPASLSIITSAYSDARTRRRAAGIWGAAGCRGLVRGGQGDIRRHHLTRPAGEQNGALRPTRPAGQSGSRCSRSARSMAAPRARFIAIR